MSVAYYIVTDQDIPDLDADVDGKTFARHYPALDALTSELGLPEIDYFVSIPDDELEDLLGSEALSEALGEDGEDEEDGIAWRSAEEGLAFFRALAVALQARADRPEAEALGDVTDYVRVLEQLQPHGARFFLAIDF